MRRSRAPARLRFDCRPAISLGRHVFGVATLAFGVIALIWHAHPAYFVAAAVAQIAGGIAMQFPPAARLGAAIAGVAYLTFAVLAVPGIVAAPRVYNSWGNFFEQLSLVTGAVLVYRRATIGRVLFGACTASFAIEQAVYLDATARLVPKWIPPGQTFWAIATTAVFVLAAVALVTGVRALPAARVTALMIVLFGVLVWVPLLFANPRSHGNWSETVETFAIAGVAWILADILSLSSLRARNP